MEWQEYFTSFMESELQLDVARAAVLAAKMEDMLGRLRREENPEAILNGIDSFVEEFHDDFTRLAGTQRKKQSTGRRRQKKKTQMDMFKSKSKT